MTRQLRLFENVQGSNPRLGSEALTRAGKRRGWREQKNFDWYWQKLSNAAPSAGSQNSQGKPWGSKRGISRNSHKLELKGLDRPPKVQLHNSWMRSLPAPVLASQLKPQCELFLTSLLLAMAWPISGAFSLSPSCFSGLLTKSIKTGKALLKLQAHTQLNKYLPLIPIFLCLLLFTCPSSPHTWIQNYLQVSITPASN